MSRNTKLLKNTVIYFLGNFASKCLSFILVPIYTSYLGAEDFGNVNLLLLLSPILAQFFSCEILDGAYRFLMDADTDEEKSSVITNSIFIYIMGMFMFGVIYIPISIICHLNNSIVFVLHVMLVNFVSLQLYIARGIKNNKAYAAGGVIQTLVQGMSNIAFIVGMHMGAVSILWAPVVASIVVTSFLELRLRLFKLVKKRLIDIEVCKRLVRYSFPLYIQVLFIWILQNAGTYQLLFITGDTYLSGIYSMVNKFPQMVYAFTSIFVLAWQESAVEERSANDKNKYYIKIYNGYINIQLIGLVILLPMLYIYFAYYNQGDFGDVKRYIPLALFSSMIISAVNFITTNYIVNKKTNNVVITSIIPAIISVVVSQIMIPSIDIIAVYLGAMIGYGIMYLLRYYDMKKEINFKLNLRKLSPSIVAFLIICLGYYLLSTICYVIVSIVVFFILGYVNRQQVYMILAKSKTVIKSRKK